MLLQCPDCRRGHGFVVPGARYTCRCGTVLMLGGETGKRTDLLNRDTVGSTPTQAADEQQGYDRLMACLMHSDDERCEVCGDDPI